jgi:hypothetical protein
MKHKFLFICTASLMVLLGTSDAMRGIFTPLFREGYGFSVEQLGVIVSLSYVGNLLCLLAGGVVLDAMGRRRALVVFILLLAASELLLLQGSRFSFLAVGFFLTLGLSTLLNATVNLISSEFSEKKKLAVVNSLFFIQGVGTSGSQLVFSHYASSQAVFSGLVGVLAVTLALLSLPFFLTRSFAPKVRETTTTKGSGKTDMGAVALLTGALAFYLIAEHGVTNYLILYGSEHLKQSAATAGTALALFSAGIMVGRLILAPMVDSVGPIWERRSDPDHHPVLGAGIRGVYRGVRHQPSEHPVLRRLVRRRRLSVYRRRGVGLRAAGASLPGDYRSHQHRQPGRRAVQLGIRQDCRQSGLWRRHGVSLCQPGHRPAVHGNPVDADRENPASIPFQREVSGCWAWCSTTCLACASHTIL